MQIRRVTVLELLALIAACDRALAEAEEAEPDEAPPRRPSRKRVHGSADAGLRGLT